MVTRKTSRIMVVGAGLAGAACARALARAGLRVVLVEAGPAPAGGASGNPVGILHPLISKDNNLASQWTAAGMQTSLRWCQELAQQDANKSLFDTCGVLQLAESKEEADAWLGLPQKFGFDPTWLDYWPADRVAGFLSEHCAAPAIAGLWCAQGTWIRPAVFVDRCLRDAQAHGATIIFNHRIESPQQITALLEADFDGVVLCAAREIQELVPQAMLRLNAVRGAITAFSPSGAAVVSGRTAALNKSPATVNALPTAVNGLPATVNGLPTAVNGLPTAVNGLPAIVCLDGYATPLIDGQVIVGATFERLSEEKISSPLATREDAEENLARLHKISPMLAQQCRQANDVSGVSGISRVSIRSATHDRMPLVGRIADLSLPLAANISQIAQMPRDPRIFVLGGLGSRGLATAPLGAELITAMITGQPLLLPAALINSVDPARFALRAHQRRDGVMPAAQAVATSLCDAEPPL